jgi:hypothetical protein
LTRSRQTADWGSRAGLAKIVPSSVAVGSGTGSSDALGTVTFSGCSSVSLNDVFSATYDHYKINIIYTPSTAMTLSLRLRDVSSAITAANYAFQVLTSDSSSGGVYVNNTNGRTQTSASISNTTASIRNMLSVEMFSPFLSQITTWRALGTNGVANHINVSGSYNTGTSATGFEINTSTGTTSGTIQIYGYTQ